MERLQKNVSQIALVLGSALCVSLAGCNERNQQGISSGTEQSELSALPAAKIHFENALKVIQELAPERSSQPTFTVEGEFESARRFIRALALDFEQAGIPTPEPSEDFFTHKKDMHHPIRANQLGYTERVPGHGMIILLFPDAIELMAEKVDVPIDAMRRYVAADELGHVYLNDYLLSKGFPDRLLGGYGGSVVSVKFPFFRTRALSLVEFS